MKKRIGGPVNMDKVGGKLEDLIGKTVLITYFGDKDGFPYKILGVDSGWILLGESIPDTGLLTSWRPLFSIYCISLPKETE